MKIKKDYLDKNTVYLKNKHVAVMAKVVELGKLMILSGTLCSVDKSTPIVKMPENFQIIDENGEELKPTGEFYVTVQTIDPYHLVLDI